MADSENGPPVLRSVIVLFVELYARVWVIIAWLADSLVYVILVGDELVEVMDCKSASSRPILTRAIWAFWLIAELFRTNR